MKITKITIYFLLIMLFVFLAISCSNSLSNNTNLGLSVNAFQKHEDWIYYINYMNLYRVRTNGKHKMKIDDDTIYSFKVHGDRIYYISGSDYYLYSMKSDGSDKEIITHPKHGKFKVRKMDVADNLIYVLPLDGSSLVKIKSDGTEFIELDDRIVDFNIDGEWIYYFHMIPEEKVWVYQLWRMRTDGTQKQQLMQDTSYNIDYDAKWIYYVDDDNQSIYKVGFEVKEKQKIIDCADGTELKVVGDWLIYHDTGECPGLYKIKIDGSERTKITDDTFIDFIDIWDNWLICSGQNISFIRVNNSYDTDEIIKEIISDWPNIEIYE